MKFLRRRILDVSLIIILEVIFRPFSIQEISPLNVRPLKHTAYTVADLGLKHGDVLVYQYRIIDKNRQGEKAEKEGHYLLPPTIAEYLAYLVHKNSTIKSGPFASRSLTKPQDKDKDILSALQEQKRRQREKNVEALYIGVRRKRLLQP